MSMAAEERRAVLLRGDDNVAVAARPIPAGFVLALGGSEIEVREPIKLGHKVALQDIAEGEPVVKYGQIIGFASRPIKVGSWVHVQNTRADLFERDYAYASAIPSYSMATDLRTFPGFLRPDGRVGTRNYIAVISTVNCSAGTSKFVSERFRGGAWKRDFPNVDGVFSVTHKVGCGIPFNGPDHKVIDLVLAGFANHPNVAAYVIVGLGCEVTFAQHLIDSHDLVTIGGRRNGKASEKNRPTFLNIQEQGGITKTVEAAVEAVHQLLPAANEWRRTEQPVSKLLLAMECGGSDGNSGVTANPALGVASDILIAHGGATVLGETTEIYGAEHLLTRRAVSRGVGEKLVERIKWWEWYAGVFNADINNNPSPGNKEGGLTTIYEKSLGALAKAGSMPLVDVVGYAEKIDKPGLHFMDTPGFDPVCTTGLVASGANVLAFTTGRGSVLGLLPTPCVKIATNTPMYDRMVADMDFNAGTVLEGESLEDSGRRLFEMIVAVAGGEPTKSEKEGVGEEEFSPWQIGPLL
jgi:altronate hydrolase